MQNTKRRLRNLTVFPLIIMCFAVLMGQSSGKGESNSTKSVWQFFMEHKIYLVAPAIDGYFWRKMSEKQRFGHIIGYIIGFEEGAVAAWVAATGDTQFPFDALIPRISYEEVLEAVDEFYSDYANRGICLSTALPIIMSRIGGYISDEEAKNKIQEARKAGLKIPKAPAIPIE